MYNKNVTQPGVWHLIQLEFIATATPFTSEGPTDLWLMGVNYEPSASLIVYIIHQGKPHLLSLYGIHVDADPIALKYHVFLICHTDA